MYSRICRLLAVCAVAICIGAAPSVSTDCAAALATPRTDAYVGSSSFGGSSITSRLARPAAAPAAAPAVVPVTPPGSVVGRARRLRAPSPCDVPPFVQGGPGVPYFVVEDVPRAGQPFRVQWSTKPTSPTEMPAWPAMLFVSFETIAPVPLDALGAPGCHLQVQPEFVMLPMAGSILTQQGGRVNLDWTPSASLVGQDFYSQLLVFEPGVNGAGFLLSPALHVTVGN